MLRRLLWVSSVALALACGGNGEPAAEPAAAERGSAGAEAPPPAPTVSGAEARELVASGAVLLDVTPPPRAEQSRIEGRTHIPLPQLRERMDELPRDRPIVVYCFGGRGSPRAGAMLQAEGYDVHVMGARSNWDEAAAAEAPAADAAP
jgi:rhodanese-related sulfurtransferase